MLNENEVSKYSCVMIKLPDILSKKIIQWNNANISDEDIYEAPGCGREDEPHITVLYGLHTDTPNVAKEIACKVPKFTVELTTMSLFLTNPEFDVVKIGVKSSALHDLNDLFRRRVEYTNKFKEYKPHVTLAYLKKGRGWKHEGDEEFKGKMFEVTSLVFSNSYHDKTNCPLKKGV